MTDQHYADDRAIVYHGDCREVLAELAPDIGETGWADAIVTDPPYELKFMGKGWDGLGVAFDPETWKRCYEVLKPGGYLLAFGGSRTWHRMAVAIEDAGFEIRDSIAWLYGSGFPKSMDVSKAIDKAAGHARASDYTPNHGNEVFGRGMGGGRTTTTEPPIAIAAKQWQGWGTALKPAFEPIVVARKPLSAKTVAANVLEHGTGAIHIDACRVGSSMAGPMKAAETDNTVGRWPTNVVLDGAMADELDAQGPRTKDGVATNRNRTEGEHSGNTIYAARNVDTVDATYGGEGGPARFFPVFKYQAKAPAKERPKVDGVAHPTVKPLELMRWLVRLVTPPGGTIIDPFAGSGTTIEAALAESVQVVGIEYTADYLPLITARIERTP